MSKGYKTGIGYFFVHFFTEIICFALIASKYPPEYAAITAFLYDAFAFVPQAFFGEFIARHRKIDLRFAALGGMAVSIFIFEIPNPAVHVLAVLLLALSNAIIHEYGALDTVKVSKGRLAPSAVFVSGGSFGLVIGKFYYDFGLSTYWLSVPLLFLGILLIYLGKKESKEEEKTKEYPVFNICRPGVSASVILVVALVVTAVRGYTGYAIPISWCERTGDFFILYFLMGTGKALGGILSDRFGAGIIGVISAFGSIPFLILGRDNMLISVFGIMLFSMTMAVTFGMTLTALPQNPGLAFGITTIGLFIGTLPPMFYRPDMTAACIIVVALSVFSGLLLGVVVRLFR